jgi:hypothetical protein
MVVLRKVLLSSETMQYLRDEGFPFLD